MDSFEEQSQVTSPFNICQGQNKAGVNLQRKIAGEIAPAIFIVLLNKRR